MIQIVLNKKEDKETMIFSLDDNKKIFIKNKSNKDSEEGKLYQNIIDLVSNYFEDGEL